MMMMINHRLRRCGSLGKRNKRTPLRLCEVQFGAAQPGILIRKLKNLFQKFLTNFQSIGENELW